MILSAVALAFFGFTFALPFTGLFWAGDAGTDTATSINGLSNTYNARDFINLYSSDDS